MGEVLKTWYISLVKHSLHKFWGYYCSAAKLDNANMAHLSLNSHLAMGELFILVQVSGEQGDYKST